MGPVRVVAGLTTRQRPEKGLRLPTGHMETRRWIRGKLEKQYEARRQRRCFRRGPDTYLNSPEELLLQLKFATPFLVRKEILKSPTREWTIIL